MKEKRHSIIKEIEAKGPAEFSEGFLKSVFHQDSLTNKPEVVEQLRSVVFANTPHIITEGLLALAGRAETCSGLGEINAPTLIICGRADEVTPLAQSESMHKNIRGSQLCIIENAGHVSNLEQPTEFNEHLAMFLSTLSGIAV